MLENVLPKTEIESAFRSEDVIFSELGFKDINQIAEEQPVDLFQVGLSAWNRIVVEKSDDVDPMAMAQFICDQDPFLYQKIEQKLNKKILFDIFYAKAEIQSAHLTESTVTEVFVAHTYPNNILIGDVVFQNPKKLISAKKRMSKSQSYEGLGLLPTFMERIKQIATQKNCKFALLSAYTLAEYRLFLKYGFVLENTPIAQRALQMGYSIPMQLSISSS